jgi:hypothetical protein
MPIYRPTTVDAIHLDGVLSLDLDRGRAVVDLAHVSFVDAYALTGLACFIGSATRYGLPVKVVLPDNIDPRSWLSRMHLGEVSTRSRSTSRGCFQASPSATGETR